jgi:hypothetical protein
MNAEKYLEWTRERQTILLEGFILVLLVAALAWLVTT